MVGLSMPPTTASRGIIIRMLPKSPGEKVESFSFSDDETFETLRRKCMRWAADNMLKVKAAQPALPEGFNNRLATNWKILFAIAEQAGVLEKARRAAIALSPRTTYQRSEGQRLLESLRDKVLGACKEMTSAELAQKLAADPNGEWGAFRGGGPITQRQVASLLSNYGINPGVIHPTKRSNLSTRLSSASIRRRVRAFPASRSEHPNTTPKTKGKKVRNVRMFGSSW